eukprot:11115174-Lingulodinium_polyedra.AAC.1
MHAVVRHGYRGHGARVFVFGHALVRRVYRGHRRLGLGIQECLDKAGAVCRCLWLGMQETIAIRFRA